jgi:hypothetical protein
MEGVLKLPSGVKWRNLRLGVAPWVFVIAGAEKSPAGYRVEGQVAVAPPVTISERQQALAVRAAWMRLMRLTEEEIAEALATHDEVSLVEETANLRAAEELAEHSISNERLLAFAARNPPPASWHDEDEDLF